MNRTDALPDLIDEIFDTIDELLLQGKMAEVDKILEKVDIENTDTELLIAYLSITAAAREQLQYRAKFFNECFETIKYRPRDWTEGLLDNLE